MSDDLGGGGDSLRSRSFWRSTARRMFAVAAIRALIGLVIMAGIGAILLVMSWR